MKMETCKDICHTFGMKELYSLRKETIERGSASAKENHEFWFIFLFIPCLFSLFIFLIWFFLSFFLSVFLIYFSYLFLLFVFLIRSSSPIFFPNLLPHPSILFFFSILLCYFIIQFFPAGLYINPSPCFPTLIFYAHIFYFR